MAYFRRLGPRRFAATEHVGGAWDLQTQHIAPALGLLAHVVEQDRDERRGRGLEVSRVSYDILGTVPVEEVDVDVTVLRPGRTVELVEGTLAHGGRAVVRLRAWLMETRATTSLAGTAFPRIPAPDATGAWDPTSVWPGGFIRSADVRRSQVAPGRAHFWVRTDQRLVAEEDVSRLAAVMGLLDIANGMTVRAAPAEVAFPNVDLTAHLFRAPSGPTAGEWVGFDTSVSFGPDGVGLTSSVLHDEQGPFGTSAQLLTVRPATPGAEAARGPTTP
jgi:hypothetical protein